MRTSELDIREIDITPALAQKWLNENNTHNRPMYERVVSTYALDMKRGKWLRHHQGICLDDTGTLIDGQHRLAAIVRSGKTVRMMVVRGMPKVQGANGDSLFTQDAIDDIKKRSNGDKMHLSYGVKDANLKAAICAAIVLVSTSKATKISVSMTMEIYRMYQHEIDVVVSNRGTTRGLVLAPVFAAFALSAASFSEKAIEFEKGYFSGENLTRYSPILAFRNYMLNRSIISNKTYGRYTIASHALNAMMHHVLGNNLKKLVQTRQGIDFFVNKQKRVYSELLELLKL